MKIAIIQNCNIRGNHQLTMLGRLQACYLIQRALGWFVGTDTIDLMNNTVIFTTEDPYDLEPAIVAANSPDINYIIPIEMIDRRWSFGNDILHGHSKAATLAKQISMFGRYNALVFAYFYDGDDSDPRTNIKPFLGHWGIKKICKWPSCKQPMLARIDTDERTIEFDYPLFPPPRE